jgi:hypothetical protein
MTRHACTADTIRYGHLDTCGERATPSDPPRCLRHARGGRCASCEELAVVWVKGVACCREHDPRRKR